MASGLARGTGPKAAYCLRPSHVSETTRPSSLPVTFLFLRGGWCWEAEFVQQPWPAYILLDPPEPWGGVPFPPPALP